jgi:NAD(P)-dependent dehydrogenase (short-subunit alcohol dehydrogenase family)
MAGLLEETVGIITGAGGGIGRETALLFAREGATVVLADRDEPAGEETARLVAEQGGDATFVATDITRRADVRALVAAAVARRGTLDWAFNNAGVIGVLHPLVGYPDAEFERVIDVNVKGTWYCLQEELAAMLDGGRAGAIVNASSGLGAVGAPAMGAYVAAKHAVLGMTRAAALDYAAHGIRVNALLPGIVDTAMPARLTESAPEVMEIFRTASPVGRLATAGEVAEAAAWLCSPRASFVNGHGLAVDGGMLSQ